MADAQNIRTCPVCAIRFTPKRETQEFCARKCKHSRIPTVARFMRSVVKEENGCWRWTGKVESNGYGRFTAGRITKGAHRASYEFFVGPIPEGMTIDHTCHKPETCPLGTGCPHRSCLNPQHLEVTTDIENMRRGHGPSRGIAASREKRKAITHCPHGHEYSPENTIIKN